MDNQTADELKEVADNVINTIRDPSPANLMADLELVLKLIKRHKLSELHQQAKDLLKAVL